MSKTKKEFFNEFLTIPAISDNEEYVNFLKKEIALLDKKAAAPKKPTANQTENERLKNLIVQYLTETCQIKSIAELTAAIPDLNGKVPQKIAPLVNTLVKEGALQKEYVKRVPYYGIKR